MVQKILPIPGLKPRLFICFVNAMHKACHLPVFLVFSTQENLDAASQAADALHAKADALGEWESEWLDSARTHIREQPLTAIAVGLLAGVLLSRLAR